MIVDLFLDQLLPFFPQFFRNEAAQKGDDEKRGEVDDEGIKDLTGLIGLGEAQGIDPLIELEQEEESVQEG